MSLYSHFKHHNEFAILFRNKLSTIMESSTTTNTTTTIFYSVVVDGIARAVQIYYDGNSSSTARFDYIMRMHSVSKFVNIG